MDPITHTLVGVAISRTRAAQRVRRAGAALIVGANLPDIDVLSLLRGADAGLEFRRGWTHGAPALLLLPAIWVAILLAVDRLARRRTVDLPPLRGASLLGWCYLGCLTHPLLDWLNTYGIRLLMPFDGSWFYGDSLFIVDPWLWLILAGGLYLASGTPRSRRLWGVAALLSTGVIFAAGALVPATARIVWLAALIALWLARRRIAAGGARTLSWTLLLASLYVGSMICTSHLASGWVRRALPAHGVETVDRMMLSPTPADPSRWSVVVESGDHYRRGAFYLRPTPRLELSRVPIRKSLDRPEVRAAMAAAEISGAMRWMRFPSARVIESDDGYTVHFFDVRYGQRRRGGFGSALVRLDRELNPQTAGGRRTTDE